MSDFAHKIRTIFFALGLPLTEIGTLLSHNIGNFDSLIDNEERFHQHGFSDMSPACQDVFGNMATYIKKMRQNLPHLDLMDYLNVPSFCAAHELMQEEKSASPNTIPTWEPTETWRVQIVDDHQAALQMAAEQARTEGQTVMVILPDGTQSNQEEALAREVEALAREAENQRRAILPLFNAANRFANQEARRGLDYASIKESVKNFLLRHGLTEEEAQGLTNGLRQI